MADRLSLEDQVQREGFYTGGYKERPAIHVAVASGVNGAAFQHVEVGAEEEGVPCRWVDVPGDEAVALAYAAAQSSRFGVGVGIGPDQVAIHEVHMPAGQPVLRLAVTGQVQPVYRLAGSNAARLVIRLPLRFVDPLAEPAVAEPPVRHTEPTDHSGEPLSPAEIRAAVRAIVRVLRAYSNSQGDRVS